MKRATPKFRLALKRAELNEARASYRVARDDLAKANKGISKKTRSEVFIQLNRARKALGDAIIETTIALTELKQQKLRLAA